MKATARELLRDAYERIEDISRWTQGPVARDSVGCACRPSDPDACQWCAVGSLSLSAAGMAGDPEVHTAIDALNQAARDLYGLPNFVNVGERLGHAAILEVFVAAMANLSSVEGFYLTAE